MIREKLTIKISGDAKSEIIDAVIEQVRNYLELDNEDDLSRFVDIELDICAENDTYNATAYVRIKN